MRNKAEIISTLSKLSELSRLLSANPAQDYAFLKQLSEEEAMDLIQIVSSELFPDNTGPQPRPQELYDRYLERPPGGKSRYLQ
jgi:hypothetical protein